MNLPPLRLFNTRRWVGEFYPSKSPLRDAFPVQNTSYTLRAARRPCLYALAMPAPPPITRVATLSSLLTGTMGPKGIKWDPRGDPRAPSAPFGGMGPGGPLGLFRSHSEWKAISNGKQLRMEGHSEIKTHFVRLSKAGRAE